LTEIPFDYTSEINSAITTTLYPASNGDLISVGLTGEILQIDTASWKVKNTYHATAGIGIAPGVATWGNILAVNSADKIALYDLESGGATGDITTTGSSQSSYMQQAVSVLTIPSDGSAYLYSNESGIYRVPMDTTVSERLVDGGLSSLGIQTLSFTNLFAVGDDEYLALAKTMEQGYRIFRYTFNPDIPTEPSQVLGVYSLRDNKTIRQAISGYQTLHPDVRVNYQVGLVEGSGVTAADAMRTLSTELLAGKGPDVIVLDDMDVDGYIQKNVLRDITDLASGTDTLSNITGAYGQDGKLHAIPARFYIPMLLGDGVEDVRNLSDFTAWLDTAYTKDIGIRSDELVERFYAACSYRWFTEDSGLNEEAFRSDLEQLGKLAEGIRDVGEVQSFDDVAIDTLLWYGGAIAANYGIVSGYVDVALFDAAIQNRPTGSYHPFPNDEGDIFIPGTVLGINAATGSPDSAESFVQYVLSEEVQATHLGDGFPVNSAAFEQLSQNPAPGSAQDEMLAQLAVQDARTGELTEVSLSGAWPSDEFMSELKTMLRGVQVPVKANAVIREMVIDETAGFIGGTKSLDDTVRSLAQKMDLYLSE
ncbi:MAG: ABC transporter substrate-binding protein, partial [Oscillospiraceae bacterium]